MATMAQKRALDPEKTYKQALDMFNSGNRENIERALELAKGSFAAQRSNEAKALTIDCFIKLNQQDKAREWLKDKEKSDAEIDATIHIRERALAEKWRERKTFSTQKKA